MKISNAAEILQHSEPNWMFYLVFTGRVQKFSRLRVSRDGTRKVFHFCSNFEKRQNRKAIFMKVKWNFATRVERWLRVQSVKIKDIYSLERAGLGSSNV